MDATSALIHLKVPPPGDRCRRRLLLPTRKFSVRLPSLTPCSPTFAGSASLPPNSAASDTPVQRGTALLSSQPEKKNSFCKRRSPMASFFDALEDIINRFLEPVPLHPSVDPEHVLAGNFAPVEELPPTLCPILKGRIPRCLLGGAYVRIGPNPGHRPRGPYHLFDGDGMLHSLLLPTGDAGGEGSLAIFCSRYVRTQWHAVERSAGVPVLPNYFAFRGLAGVARGAVSAMRTIAGQINPWMGVTPTNANLFLFNDRLLALGEADHPHHIHLSPDDGDI